MRRNDAMRRHAFRPKQARSLRPLLEAVEKRVLLTTFTVKNTLDNPMTPDAGSLREAILQSNAAGGTNIINFNIAASGTQTIALVKALPAITTPVTIDGTTESGYGGTPVVVLNGSGAGQGADGLDISAGASTVKGLTINGFAGEGISLSGAGSNTVTQNYIGTTATGNVAGPNGLDGILVQSGSNTNTISNNTISGNLLNGIYLNGQAGGSATTTTTGNIIAGNRIGAGADGMSSVGNTGNGILLQNAPMTTIGGTGGDSTRNIIASNANGINLLTTFDGTLIEGNYIGTDSSGTTALGNNGNGVPNAPDVYNSGVLIQGTSTGVVIGGSSATARNVLSGNQYGILDIAGGSTDLLIQGNYVGTDSSGTNTLGNASDGIYLADSNVTIGGTATGAGNVISGNGGNGINVSFGSSAIAIQGNYVGTDSTGTAALGNGSSGIDVVADGTIIGGTATGAGNIIAYNGFGSGSGVTVDGALGVTILSNSIHDDAVLGIDLANGGNNDQPSPVLTSAVSNNTTSQMTGTLTVATPGTYTLQFFATPGPNASGNAEGQLFLGTGTVVATFNPTVAFSIMLPSGGFLPGSLITATATNVSTGDTSEFSDSVLGTGTGAGTIPPVITVASSATTVAAGTNVTDTFTISNTSTVTAAGVAFSDVIPTGTTFFSGTTSTGASVVVTNGVANATIGRIAAGTSVTVTIVLTTGGGAVPSFTNTGEVTATVPTVAAGEDTVSTTTNVTPSDDLAISVVGPTTPVPVGQNITYSVTVNNNGPSDATGVTVVNTLPAGTTFVSATSSTGETPTVSGGTLTDVIGALASGDLVVITIVVATNGGTPTTVADTASVTGDQADSDDTNNTATASTSIVASADLAITSETVNPTTVSAGNTVTFTINVANNGPSAATGVLLTDMLPTGLTFVSGTAAGGQVTVSNGTVTAPLGTLASGGSTVVTIVAMATGSGVLADSSSVASDDADPDTTNNTGSASVTVLPLSDLSVVLSGPTGQFNINNPLTYTAVVTNTGPSPATNVMLLDPLFAGASFVLETATNGTSGSDVNGVATLNLGTLAAGETVTVTLIVLPTVAGTVTETSTVSATEADPNPANNSSSVTTVLIVPQPIIEFSQNPYVVNETDGTATITLNRVGDTSGALTVHFSTVAGGNATPGLDYTPVSTIVTFAAGVSTATVTVPLLLNPLDRVNEFVNLQLDTPTGGAILVGAATSSTAILEIINDDPVLVGPTVTDVKLFGPAGAITGIEVDTTGNLDPATASLASNYTIIAYGGKGGIPTGTIIPVSLAVYNPATGAVLLFPSTPLPANELFLIDINATRPGAVTDLAGNPLNSVYGSVGASDYLLSVARGNDLTYTDENGATVNLKLTGPGTIDIDRTVGGQVGRLQILGGTRKTTISGSVKSPSHKTTIGTILGLGRFGSIVTKLYTPPFYLGTAAYPNPAFLYNTPAVDTLFPTPATTTKTTKTTVKAKAIATSTSHAKVKHPHAAVAHAAAHTRAH